MKGEQGKRGTPTARRQGTKTKRIAAANSTKTHMRNNNNNTAAE